MELSVFAKSYNCYGGHPTISPIADFLLMGAGPFGAAIKEVTVTLHFASSGKPARTLEGLWEIHRNTRLTLPKVTYYRAKGTVEINVASELIDGRNIDSPVRLSLPLFVAGVDEIIHSLSLIRPKLKRADDFDVDAFLSHCEAMRERIPGSEKALRSLFAELAAADKAKRAALSPWDKLGIDWEDFHPRARTILDDPFLWDCGHDFSPNGNDTGADVLEHYREWRQSHRKTGSPRRFFEQLLKEWEGDGMDDDDRHEAIIGLAFADIKLRAECDEQIRMLAIQALDRQHAEAKASKGWPHRDERLRTLKKIKAKLQQVNGENQGKTSKS